MIQLLAGADLLWLKAALQKAGLLGALEFASYNDGRLQSSPFTGLVYKETRAKMSARLHSFSSPSICFFHYIRKHERPHT